MKNILKNYLRKTLTILLVFISLNSYSQFTLDWMQSHGGSARDVISDLKQTQDGGFISVGHTASNDFDVSSNNGGLLDAWAIKTDASGHLLWEKNYGGSGSESFTAVHQTIDGGFIFSGQTTSNDVDVSSSNGSADFWLVKTDNLGNILWEQTYGGTNVEECNASVQTLDGGYILTGSSVSANGDVSANNGSYDYWVLKTDSVGNKMWEKNYGGSTADVANDIIQTSDSSYIIAGESNSTNGDVSGNNGNTDAWIVKIDKNGTMLWEKSYGTFGIDGASSIKETNTGYVFAGNSDYDFWVLSLDYSGNVLWENYYGGTDYEEAITIVKDSNDDYMVVGHSVSNDGDVTANYGGSDIWLIKIDNLGNLIWEQNYGGTDYEYPTKIIPTDYGSYVFAGYTMSNDIDFNNNYGDYDSWIAQVLPLAQNVFGTVYLEDNNNCFFDSGDETYRNIIVQAQEILSSNTYYNNTDTNGEFYINIDTTSYEVSVVNLSPYWESSTCSQDTQTVNPSSVNISDTIDFYFSPTVSCPYLEVDISARLLRRCYSSDYYISYCNNGSAIANNAYVEIEFDQSLTINSSSIPWTTIVGNVYRFPIGDVAMFDCGSFSVNITVPCDSSTFVGQVLCTEAHIYPDSLCLPSSNSWNGADLKAKAECVGQDSVRFALKNIGSGNMNVDVPIIGIEDVILVMDTNEILNAGQEISWTFPTNGIKTHRIIAQQPSDHPYKTFTTDAVANCNLMASAGPPPVTDSAFLAYPNDEESPFEAVDCQPIIGSYDPNDKTVYPTGAGASHFITETTDLEYKIRFQNTGNDTAFTVVVRDSISSLLDVSSFSAGASSHAYSYNLYGNGVIEFTFNNILLPDSFVNEPASHGFVQYKIVQKETNMVGDVILNNADIFFDFNEPIRTNTTFNEIGGIFLDTIIYKSPYEEEAPNGISEVNNLEIKVYPNPAKNNLYFEFEESQKDVSIELFDLSGKMQQKTVGVNTSKLKVTRGNLVSGMYLFKIYTEGNEIAFGKLVFN